MKILLFASIYFSTITTNFQMQPLHLNTTIPITQASLETPIKYQDTGYRTQNRQRPATTSPNHCLRDARDNGRKYLTALVPKYNAVVTTSDNPKFFFYIPKTSKTYVQAFDFTLEDANKQVIYQRTFKVNHKSGVFTVSLKANTNQVLLKTGQDYTWYFSAICDASDRSLDLGVVGLLKRISLEKNLITELNQASPRERAVIFATSGIWENSITTLAELRLKKPKDESLKTDWQTLLESVKLSTVAEEPLIEELKPK